MKKIINKKLIITLIVVVLAAIAYFIFFQEKKLYLTFVGNNKIEVPADIAKSKDCDELRNWVNALKLSPELTANIKCPWEEYSDYVHYTMDGYEFKIPRKNIYVGQYSHEGEKRKIYLELFPKNKIPFKYSKDKFQGVSVTLEKSKDICMKKECYNSSMTNYYVTLESGIKKTKKIEENIFNGLDYYRVNGNYREGKWYYYQYQYYINSGDNILNPTDWYICKDKPVPTGNESCKSSYAYKGIKIEYKFVKEYLPQHKEIRKLIEKNIDNFMIKEGV